MNAPILHMIKVPARKGMGGRSDQVHAAIYTHYMHADRSAEDTAALVNAELGTRESRNSIISYANRQKWLKGSTKPKPHIKAPRSPNPPKPLRRAPALPPRDEGPDLSPDNALEPDRGPPTAGNYRFRLHPPNDKSTTLADMPGNGAGICHFPVGPDQPGQMDLQLFCGVQCVGPYCRAHHRLAYSPYKAQEVRPHDTTPRPTRRPA